MSLVCISRYKQGAKIESSPLSATFKINIAYINKVKLIKSQEGSVESGDDFIFANWEIWLNLYVIVSFIHWLDLFLTSMLYFLVSRGKLNYAPQFPVAASTV